MKRLILAIFLNTISISAIAQSTQNGRIAEYNGKKAKTPLANVEIKVKNAGSNVSDKKGMFTLSFRTLKPGDKIDIVSITKEGYEIFNKDALDSWRIANDGSTFTIVLCKSVSFKKLKDQYNSVASKSYAQQKEKDEATLAALLKDGKLKQAEYERQLKALKDKYDEQLENLDNYIDQFARIDLSELSSQEQKIIEMVQAGKIDEAIKAYEDMKLEDKYAQAVQNINVATDAIKQLENVKSQNAKAKEQAYAAVKRMNDTRRLQGGEESYSKIEASLKSMYANDSTNLMLIEDYANYSYDQKNFLEATLLLRKAIELDNNVEHKAVHLQWLGNIYNESRNTLEAQKCLKESVAILDSIQSSCYTINNAKRLQDCYISLGNLSSIVNNPEDAIAYYKLADKIFSEVNDTTFDAKKRHYVVLSNIGTVLYLNCGKYIEGIPYLLKAIPLIEQCYSISNNLDDLFGLENTELSLASAYMDSKQDSLALMHFDKAEKSYNILTEKNPEAFLRRGIELYNQIGVFYLDRKDFIKSAETFYKAYSISQKCYEEQKALVYKIYMLVTKGSYGCALSNINGKEKEAIRNIQQSCEEMEKIYPQQPDMLRPYYSILLQQLADTQDKVGEYNKAMETLDKAMQLTPQETKIYYTKGEIYLHVKRYADALVMWEKVLEINPNYKKETFTDLKLYEELKVKGYIKE